jgi:peptidoglycan/xylan/chitin deacetylase (PgdA/CDA1 family)
VSVPEIERLLVDKERLIVGQKERHERLDQRKGELEAELRALHDAIGETVTQLHALGRERVEFGDLRRTAPISPVWGLDRGIPLDRYYIHRFLERHKSDIRGCVLEVKDPGYTRAFGDDRVTASDVLDVDPTNTRATLVVDLSHAETIADDTYDCFILTQTLGVIYDVAGALRHAVRILKPGGVLLCTLPAAGRISYEEGLDGDYWRFTEASVRRLFAEVLPPGTFEVNGYGNVLACTAFLYGLAPHELSADELDTVDPYFPVVYTVRAVKPLTSGTSPRGNSRPTSASLRTSTVTTRAAVLTYHRVADSEQDRHQLCVPIAEFRSQMQHLRDTGCHVMPLHNLVVAATAGDLDERSVSLTFDDGYLDALTHVAPILQEFGFPATFFIVGAALDAAHEFWWDALERVFLTDRPLPERLVLGLPGRVLELSTAGREQQVAAHDRIVDVFYQLDRDGRQTVLRALEAWSGCGPPPMESRKTMAADEVLGLVAVPGMSIGAHSQHHLWLPLLSSAAKKAEIETCKARLEMVVGHCVKAFSYPYGATDADTVRCVREAGFEVAVTTDERAVTSSVDPLLVPRFEVHRSGVAMFASRLDALMSVQQRARFSVRDPAT